MHRKLSMFALVGGYLLRCVRSYLHRPRHQHSNYYLRIPVAELLPRRAG